MLYCNLDGANFHIYREITDIYKNANWYIIRYVCVSEYYRDIFILSGDFLSEDYLMQQCSS